MLQLNNVSVGYDDKAVIESIDLNIKSAEIFAFMGLNGSGKSTLLRSIIGLLKPIQGNITIDGKELASLPAHERAQKISLLDSLTSVAFPMSVQELMEISIRLHGQKNLIPEALHAVGLEGFEERNLLELSSGEAKRALIAHTLATKSQIVVLDEPFSHLDWSHQQQLVKSLKNWNERYHTTFVLAAHELEWLIQLAHTVCALGNKKILAKGSPEEVFQSPLVCEVFAFQTRIDENPIDGSRRLTLGRQTR